MGLNVLTFIIIPWIILPRITLAISLYLNQCPRCTMCTSFMFAFLKIFFLCVYFDPQAERQLHGMEYISSFSLFHFFTSIIYSVYLLCTEYSVHQESSNLRQYFHGRDKMPQYLHFWSILFAMTSSFHPGTYYAAFLKKIFKK